MMTRLKELQEAKEADFTSMLKRSNIEDANN